MNVPNKVRIDKWLWSVRLFKTRTIASDACKAGKVKIDQKSVKPSYMLEAGQLVAVRQKEKLWKVKVLRLLEKRVSAAIAVDCYEDLSPPVLPSEKSPSFFYAPSERRERGAGRPTKRERRDLDSFKGNSRER